MKNTLIWEHLNHRKINLTLFEKKNLDFDYKIYEKEHNLKIITIFDKEFPTILTRLDNCPYVLYCKGNTNLLNVFNTISIVGKRNPNHEFDLPIREIVGLIKPDIIISGMAVGWDSFAHHLAFQSDIKTIAVLPAGFDVIYPPSNFLLFEQILEKGLVITEYPIGTKLKKENFLERNRIVCGLSTLTICVEPTPNSGTSNSLRTSYEIGNEVIIVPNIQNVY